MKILIIEAYTDGNIGSGALVENSIYLLRKNFHDAEIEILAQFPEHIEKFTGLPSFHELIPMPFKQHRIKQGIWLLKTITWMLTHTLMTILGRIGVTVPISLYTFDKTKLRALDRIAWADMIVSVGAERINDNFYKSILFSLYMLWIANLSEKFLVLFPQTIGPFHFRLTRFLSEKILSCCDVIFLRDPKSYDTVKRLGVKCPIVVNTCDVAILQSAALQCEANRILEKNGVPDENSPLVGISAMKWDYFKAIGTSRYIDYINVIARLADNFIEEKGIRIVFLSTNLDTHGCRENDIETARDILAIMRNKNKAHIISQLCTPAQMKGIMGLLEMCLVTRMHACIFSTGIFTPTISINYQFKLHEYMKLIGLGDYTIDIDKVTYRELKRIAERAWNDRITMRQVLKKKIAFGIENIEVEMEKLPYYYREKHR